jgi:3-isopropylmalate/(R)-2-methylmalate dehydratase small subunit
MKVTGTAWKIAQDNISTDQIRPKQYSHLPFKEQGPHCLEDIDPALGSRAKPGDFIIAGRNFGCGSSTAAHGAVLGLGIAAVVAESFGRLFLSNCVSGGLWAVTCPGILTFVESGERIELDTDNWQLRNLASGDTLAAQPLPEFFREMVELGGEKGYLKARIAREVSAG